MPISLLIVLIFPKFVNNRHINRVASGYFNYVTIPNIFYSALSYRPKVHCDEQTTGKVEKERILMRVPWNVKTKTKRKQKHSYKNSGQNTLRILIQDSSKQN